MTERESPRNPNRRPGRAERRRQAPKESERGRRGLLTKNRAISLLVAVGVIGTLFLGVNLMRPTQGSEGQVPAAATTTVSAYPLRDKLMDWDSKISAGNIDLLTIAPEIADLVTQTLCKEIECDSSYQSPLNLLNNKDFKKTIYLDDPCDTSINPATLTCLTTTGCNFSLYTSGFPSGGSIIYSPKLMKYGESQSIGVKTLYTNPGVYNITVTLVSNGKSVVIPFTLTVLK